MRWLDWRPSRTVPYAPPPSLLGVAINLQIPSDAQATGLVAGVVRALGLASLDGSGQHALVSCAACPVTSIDFAPASVLCNQEMPELHVRTTAEEGGK